MAVRVMTECDNPRCSKVGDPEGEGVPPYGWFYVEADVIGCGPNTKVEVCSVECISPAVKRAIERHYEAEEEQMQASSEAFHARVLAVACPRCKAEAGESCKSAGGKPSSYHSARREAVL